MKGNEITVFVEEKLVKEGIDLSFLKPYKYSMDEETLCKPIDIKVFKKSTGEEFDDYDIAGYLGPEGGRENGVWLLRDDMEGYALADYGVLWALDESGNQRCVPGGEFLILLTVFGNRYLFENRYHDWQEMEQHGQDASCATVAVSGTIKYVPDGRD